MPIPLLPILLSKGWVTAGLDFLKKFWPYLLVIGLVLYGLHYYGNQKYDAGYNAAVVEFQKDYNKKLQEEIDAYKAKKKALETAAEEARKQTLAATQAKQEAEKKAAEYRQRADRYYSEWQEELRRGQIPVSDPDSPHYFTHGFVGMYNLAIGHPQDHGDPNRAGVSSADPSGKEIDLPQVAAAAGLERGATVVDLAGHSTIDEHALLYNAQYNYRIANTCLVERQLINEYFQKLCELGFCEQ